MQDIKKIQEFFSRDLKESKKYGEKITQGEFAKLKGTKIQYFGGGYDVLDSNENIIKISNGKTVKSINFNQFNEKGSINEDIDSSVEVTRPTQDQADRFFSLTQNEMHYLNSKPVEGQEKTFNNMEVEPWDEYDLSNWNSLVRKAKQRGKSINEASRARVSMPRFVKDKNNPNFLNVYIDYDLGPGGSSIALGKETMTGQIRRESAAEAMRLAGDVARDLEVEYNLEDIDIQDLENGKVQVFAVSDDFIDINPNMLGEAKEEDKIDIITMDVPLFIRALEYAKEDAEEDMDLHEFTEKAIAATKQYGILQMDDYDMLVGDKESMDDQLEESKIGRNYPDSITGEYEGEPQIFSGEELYDLLMSGLKTQTTPYSFVNYITYGVTDTTSSLSKEDQRKLIDWYKVNKAKQPSDSLKENDVEKIKEMLNQIKEKNPGLWANINAKQKRGKKPAHGNSDAFKTAVKAGKKINKLKEEEGVPHYTKDGKEWKGKTHKMPDDSLMSGNPHDKNGSGPNGKSEKLFHKEDLNEIEDNGPEEEAFDVELMAAANGIAAILGKELKAKQGDKEQLDEAVITSIIAAVLTGNALIGFISKISKNLAKKLNWEKGEDFAGKVHKWAHDNETAFQKPIKRILKFFIKDEAKLEATTKGIYAIVIISMAAGYGAEAVNSLSSASWFKASIASLKGIAKSDEAISTAYPIIKSFIA